ncbi:hypothetical protein V3C99_018703 [Haemonchus contortus]
MVVRIGTKEGYWTVISVYLPQASCPVYEKDEFYQMRPSEQFRKGTIYLTIRGDLNLNTSAVKGGDWKGYMEQWRERNGNRSCAGKKIAPQKDVKVKDFKVLPGEDLAPQHRPILANIVIDLLKESRTRTERRIRRWKLHQFEREHPKEKALEAGLPNSGGQTWNNAVKAEEVGLQALKKGTSSKGPSCLQNFQEARQGCCREGKKRGSGRFI